MRGLPAVTAMHTWLALGVILMWLGGWRHCCAAAGASTLCRADATLAGGRLCQSHGCEWSVLPMQASPIVGQVAAITVQVGPPKGQTANVKS